MAKRREPPSNVTRLSDYVSGHRPPPREDRQRVPEDWLRRADRLLSRPDPGPTPYCVDELIAEGAICAVQGRHKVGKTWVVIELILAALGVRPAFGRHPSANPGPVIAVFEESGEKALHRRLLALCKGYDIDAPEELLHSFGYSANQGVDLLDHEWQEALLDAARAIRPVLVVFDPFARVKGRAEENSQKELAPVLSVIRLLRDVSGAAVLFVHHTGHEGAHMRGTSDLEAYWESKITIEGAPTTGGPFTLTATHRESDATPRLAYRVAGSNEERWVRLEPQGVVSPQEERRDELHAYVHAHPGRTTDAIARAVHKREKAVRDDLTWLSNEGLVYSSHPGSADYPSGGVGGHGRSPRRKEWFSCVAGPDSSPPATPKDTGGHPTPPSPPGPSKAGGGRARPVRGARKRARPQRSKGENA